MRPYQIWRHALGRPTGEDTCVWEESDPRFYLNVGTTKDGALIVLSAGSNTTSEVRILDAAEADGKPRLVEARRQGIEYSIEHHGDEILVLSNDGAENFAAFRTPAATPDRTHWRPLVAHRDDVRLESLDVVDGFALLHERGHASTAVRIVDLAGGAESVITPPEEAGAVFLGENLDFSARRIRYSSTSVVSPVAVHEYDLDTGQAKVIWRRLVPNYDSTAYRTERRWATSEDGTRVPITLAFRADRPAGPGPCLLYGYGAYEISVNPVFAGDRSILPLLDRGGCYAIAHVRGGGELARAWYLGGKLGQKRHSFEDFIASARYLVVRGPYLGGPAGRVRRQCRRPARGSCGEPRPRAVRRHRRGGAVRRLPHHDARRRPAVDDDRARGVGQPDRRRGRLLADQVVFALRQRRSRSGTRGCW